MSRKREIGYALVVWLTAASTLFSAFPLAAYSCCCKTSAGVISELRRVAAEELAEASHPCCKAKSTSVTCGDADISCHCSCCVKAPKLAEKLATTSGYGLCPCSTQPEPQSAELTSANRLNGNEVDFNFTTHLIAFAPDFDVPSVGDIASCGTSPSAWPPHFVDLPTTLSRLTC